jgi:hypothetical protein
MAGRQLRLAGAKKDPEEKMQPAGSKNGGWVYTQVPRESKMEIPVQWSERRESLDLFHDARRCTL